MAYGNRIGFALSEPRFPQPGDEYDETEPEQAPSLLLGLVVPGDPALPFICRAAAQVAEFGFDPSEPDVAPRVIEVGRRQYEESRDAAAAALRELPPAAPDEVVYYMRIGNRVKIGWSTNLPGRLATINPEELMAVEPGGLAMERCRHRQFEGLHTHGEWFRLTGPLIEHIERLRADTHASYDVPVTTDSDEVPSQERPFDQLLYTADAATHAGVSVATIRKWVQRGHLTVDRRDQLGRPLFRWLDVAKAERATRDRARRTFAA